MEKNINKLTNIKNACRLTSVSNLDDAIDNLKEIKALCSTQINKCLSLDDILELNTCKIEPHPDMYGQKIHSRLLKHFFNNDNFVLVDIAKYNDYRKTGFHNTNILRFHLNKNIIDSIKEENTNNILENRINDYKKNNPEPPSYVKKNTARLDIRFFPLRKQIYIEYDYKILCVLIDKSKLKEDNNSKYGLYIDEEAMKLQDINSYSQTNSEKIISEHINSYNKAKHEYSKLISSKTDDTYIAIKIHKMRMDNVLEYAKYYPVLSCKLGLNIDDFNLDKEFLSNDSNCTLLRKEIIYKSKFNVFKDDSILYFLSEIDDVIKYIKQTRNDKEINKDIIEQLDLNFKTEYGKLTFMLNLKEHIEHSRKESIERAKAERIRKYRQRRL